MFIQISAHFEYQRIKISPDFAICVYVNGNIVSGTQLMSAIYDEHADQDGFLYLVYGAENTFGAV
jgi:GABA(A) receptor-associated protein